MPKIAYQNGHSGMLTEISGLPVTEAPLPSTKTYSGGCTAAGSCQIRESGIGISA